MPFCGFVVIIMIAPAHNVVCACMERCARTCGNVRVREKKAKKKIIISMQ